jgi:CHAT domain-containing protein
VPFDGLLDAAGRNLVERRDVRIGRNARSITSGGAERPVEPGGVLLVGGVDYGKGDLLSELPYTSNEIQAVAQTLRKGAFGATLLEGKAADEPGTRDAVGDNRILHFATHGFFAPVSDTESAPLWRAGIALAGANAGGEAASPANDGMLHAAELTAWPLSKVELIVLSACDTAQGDRSYVEGLSGLPSALAAAGVKRSLLARWPVDDRGAANFMARFYEHLVATKSYSGALRQTKLDAIAGNIANVGSDTWLAFALITN